MKAVLKVLAFIPLAGVLVAIGWNVFHDTPEVKVVPSQTVIATITGFERYATCSHLPGTRAAFCNHELKVKSVLFSSTEKRNPTLVSLVSWTGTTIEFLLFFLIFVAVWSKLK